MHNRTLLFTLVLLLGFPLAVWSQDGDDILARLQEIAIIDQKVMMPMRDGVRLASDIYRPKTEASVPVIFVRTPYNFNSWGDGEQRTRTYQQAYEAVSRGFALVVQNERGRYFSEGEWDILGTPVTDGYDALTWMADQSWCNGKVGTYGCSSTAEWQMGLAAMDHPAHACMVPQGFGAGVGRIGDWYEQGNWYRGGAEQMLFFAWLYGVQNDAIRPQFPKDATQEELIRASRWFDLAPERPRIDWAEAFWHLPIQDLITSVEGPDGIYEKMIRRTPNDPAWYEGGLYHDDMPFGVPSFWFCSWYDVSTGPNLALFSHVRENGLNEEVRDNQYLLIAPTLHCRYTRSTENTIVGERSVGDARFNHDELIYNWFAYWLKGEAEMEPGDMPRVKYYTMGSNEWHETTAWPPPNSEMTTWYLSSTEGANSLFGDGQLSTTAPRRAGQDAFTYDPMNPVMSYGGNVCCTGNAVEGGSFDQQQQETRSDILVYSTKPLQEGVEVTGSIEAELYLSSDVKDTDITIKLIDVYPDGRAYNLDETILRVRYREGYEDPVFMEKGEVYKIELPPLSTSNYFAAGHQIRVEISSSNFPRFTRNLNTGGNNYDEAEGVVAHNVIHFGPNHPSQVRVPIVKK
ncbi:MAG: CocE/NonD family hydrolase [Lewinella sp.]|nr:CocE/NonD family hydrolase [Lewinella sp.]